MHSISLAAPLLFACLIVGHAIPTPEKKDQLPKEKSTEPANLEGKSAPITPAAENESDDLLRQKKSPTTTFCVEIKPGAAEPCVTICDPKPDHHAPPEYIFPPVFVKPPPPPTYLIKEPSCPCGLTPPALITIPHGVSLSSLNLKPIKGRATDSDLMMEYMPMDWSNVMEHASDTRTFPESLTTTSQLNMFAEPSSAGMTRGPMYPQGLMNGATSTVNLNRGQTHLTTCASNAVPLLRDYPMNAGNIQSFQNPIDDRRFYQYKTMDGQQGLMLDPSSGMMQTNNMQYQQAWASPQRYAAGSDPQQQIISNEYARNSLGQGQLAANPNQAYQLTQQRQISAPSMYPASGQMSSPMYNGNGYQPMYSNNQPALAQMQQMQRTPYRGDQAAGPRQMTPAMRSSSAQATAQQPSSNQQQPIDRGQTSQQMAAGPADGNAMMPQRGNQQMAAGPTDGSAMMPPRGNQQKSESQQRNAAAGGYQENAEASSKQQAYQNYSGDRSTGTDQKLPSQSGGMSRSERMMRRMKDAVGGQNGSDQPFMAASATQVPQEKLSADCGQQPLQETIKA